MPDDIELASGSGGATVAADEISGVKYPRSKIVIGANNTNDGDVSSANPLPVTGTLTAVTDITNTVTVDGTVTANLSATDNAVLDTIDAVLDTINAKLVTGTVIGDVNLGATDNAVLDAIAASVGGTLTVDGSGVTQPVSGTVTANLSATDNAVLDTIDAVLDTINAKLVSGTVIGDVNLGATDNAVLDTISANTANLEKCIIQDDAPFTPATGHLMMVGGAFDDAGTDSVDEGDAGSLRISANRCAYVQIRDGAGNERGLNIDASGNMTVNLSATDNTAIDNIGTINAAILADTQVLAPGTLVKRFNVVATADGDDIIPAPTGTKTIRVRSLSIVALSATESEIYLQTATTGTDTLGNSTNGFLIATDADGDNMGGLVLSYNPDGWFDTADSDEALEVKMSSNQPMLFIGTYTEES